MTERRDRRTAETLGVLDMPAPVAELARRTWDVIVVGAGHNGLTCAAYLARAGKRVLVLEARARVGGACTLGGGLAGLPDLALRLSRRPAAPAGDRRARPARPRASRGCRRRPGLFVPFDDGTSVQLWEDDERCEAEIRRLSPGDLAGWRAFCDVKRRLRDALRPPGEGDLWVGRGSDSRADRGADCGATTRPASCSSSGRWSSTSSGYLRDERLQIAYLGQGVIGTNASPHDPGTASIHFHHASGRLGGMPGMWGYVKGGMGMVSFLLCDAAREAGGRGRDRRAGRADRAGPGGRARRRRADRRPGRRLERRPARRPSDCSATPPIPPGGPGSRRSRSTGCTVKLNVALRELPNFRARPGTRRAAPPRPDQHAADEGRVAGGLRGRAGGRAPRAALDRALFPDAPTTGASSPTGLHTMSVFAQYVPYTFARGRLGRAPR